MRSVRYLAACLVLALVAGACGTEVKRIDIRDRTIPIEARRLVADAEDSVAIARAGVSEARRELERTRAWKRELLNRDWPDDANTLLSKLRRVTDARVELAELEVEKARANLRHARAKFRLITAKTAIRNDLAIYELEPLRETVEQRSKRVGELESRILSKRQTIAELAGKWWDAYATYADEGDKTRFFYLSSGRTLPSPDLRSPETSDEESADETDEGVDSLSGESGG